MENENSNRRVFIRKLAKLGAAGGIATLLLGQLQEKKGLVPEVQALTPLYIDWLNTATGSTLLTTSGSGATFDVTNTSTSGTGVGACASATSGYTCGVYGRSDSTSGWGVYGECRSGTGVMGEGGVGVYGRSPSTSGIGVKGECASGVGVRAKSVSGNALYVDGKNYFKSAKKGTIPSGVSSYVVTVPAGITIRTAAMIFVTLMSLPNVSVKWVQRLSDTQFKIWLTGATNTNVAFGYFIVN